MIKESIVIAVLGLLGVERRRRQPNMYSPLDRRKDRSPLTCRKAKKILQDSLDRFDQTVLSKIEELEEK